MTPLEHLLLSLADDDFILGYRDSEWTGVAPVIEEDIAFSSIAQDEIGHARALYEMLERLTGTGADHIALGRQPHEYRNCRLVEHPRDDWAFTVARQFLYDLADSIRLRALAESSNRELADLAAKIAREEKYHLSHGRTWLSRLANGGELARARLVTGLERAWPLALGVFESLPGEDELLADGTLPRSTAEMANAFRQAATEACEPHGIRLDQSATPAYGGRAGQHSTAFNTLWSEMTMVYRQDPAAAW